MEKTSLARCSAVDISLSGRKIMQKWNMSPPAVFTVRAIKSTLGCTSMYWIKPQQIFKDENLMPKWRKRHMKTKM